MRRLTVTVLLLALSGCRQREKIRAEATDESPQAIESTLPMGSPKSAIQIIRGFHEIEDGTWRWSMSKFGVLLKAPSDGPKNGAKLVMKFSLPDVLVSTVGEVTVSARTGPLALASKTYASAGDFEFEADVPASAMHVDGVPIEFAVDKFLPPGALDQRELALVVSVISLENK